MAFVMPKKYGDDLPVPVDDSVKIRRVPPKMVAVTAFSGTIYKFILLFLFQVVSYRKQYTTYKFIFLLLGRSSKDIVNSILSIATFHDLMF